VEDKPFLAVRSRGNRARSRQLTVIGDGVIGGKMVQYSKLWHEFHEVAEGFGVVTLGLTFLVVLVAVAALIFHFAL
jgi:hypothetical protein